MAVVVKYPAALYFYMNSAAIRSFVCNYACVNTRSEISR